ncbi:hypothetical protein LQ327_09540 [Actinomycetospora endophytica]|uniref:Uncharacterized protein n=1 Tax=Actinomycetospora endophytica TaxID=2291215 RepID=A0ABS8P5U6_9PSEU|nr:hypothetical protein [Actinomycetospora endophytica]MCD2193623.1 hypothetical protein [Actinomycetospora endophytica]
MTSDPFPALGARLTLRARPTAAPAGAVPSTVLAAAPSPEIWVELTDELTKLVIEFAAPSISLAGPALQTSCAHEAADVLEVCLTRGPRAATAQLLAAAAELMTISGRGIDTGQRVAPDCQELITALGPRWQCSPAARRPALALRHLRTVGRPAHQGARRAESTAASIPVDRDAADQ